MTTYTTTASSGTDLDQLRTEFEALVAGDANVAKAPSGAYLAIATHLQWLGFQLARRASPQPEKPFAGPGLWFSVDVLGNPMREYAPGKWENAIWPSSQHPSVPVQEQSDKVDERARFEAWLRSRWPNAVRPIDEKTVTGSYAFTENNLLWEAWQARARQSCPPVQAGAPVGYLFGNTFWERTNPRITDEVKKFGFPLYAGAAHPAQDGEDARDAAFLTWVKTHRKGWIRQFVQHFPKFYRASDCDPITQQGGSK